MSTSPTGVSSPEGLAVARTRSAAAARRLSIVFRTSANTIRLTAANQVMIAYRPDLRGEPVGQVELVEVLGPQDLGPVAEAVGGAHQHQIAARRVVDVACAVAHGARGPRPADAPRDQVALPDREHDPHDEGEQDLGARPHDQHDEVAERGEDLVPHLVDRDVQEDEHGNLDVLHDGEPSVDRAHAEGADGLEGFQSALDVVGELDGLRHGSDIGETARNVSEGRPCRASAVDGAPFARLERCREAPCHAQVDAQVAHAYRHADRFGDDDRVAQHQQHRVVIGEVVLDPPWCWRSESVDS